MNGNQLLEYEEQHPELQKKYLDMISLPYKEKKDYMFEENEYWAFVLQEMNNGN